MIRAMRGYSSPALRPKGVVRRRLVCGPEDEVSLAFRPGSRSGLPGGCNYDAERARAGTGSAAVDWSVSIATFLRRKYIGSMGDDGMHCTGKPRRLVLASGSPRRRDLLASLGLQFEVDVSDASEDMPEGVEAPGVVVLLAEAKARAIESRHPDALVVGADTLVELDGAVFGKPRDAAEASHMLQALSGRDHRVYTGLALLDTSTSDLSTSVVETSVRFRSIALDEIDSYTATNEPMDKAGAYGMQGLGGVFVEQIIGDYWNVVGLPLRALNELLENAGCCLICRALHAGRMRSDAE